MAGAEEGRRRVTSIDVAERAGVSQSTVSRALAGSPTITEATRARVEAAASELGYHVNMRAAGLRKGETGAIAIVVIGREGEEAAALNPFTYSLLGASCAAVAERGYEALVSFQTAPDESAGRYIERRQADAVLVLGTATNEAAWHHYRALADDGAAMAFWGSPFDDAPWVRSDNHAGGRLAVQRLLAGRARNIVFVGDTGSSQRQFSERFDGYAAAMTAAGLKPRPPMLGEGATRAAQGRDAVRGLAAGTAPFDGLFFACDAMALGALEELAGQSFAVPGDVAVIGFDGLGSGAFSTPPLTTIEPDFAAAGQLLVETALGQGRAAAGRRVPIRLVERGSVAPPAPAIIQDFPNRRP